VNGGDDAQEDDGHDRSGQEMVHQHWYDITVDLGIDGTHPLENAGTKALKSGEEEQGDTDDERRHEHLLPGQCSR